MCNHWSRRSTFPLFPYDIVRLYILISLPDSIRYFAKIVPLLRKFKFILLVLVCKWVKYHYYQWICGIDDHFHSDFIIRLNAWRDTEKEIITRRMQMQLKVRKLVKDFGPSTREGFMVEMERCVPEVVLEVDSKRTRRRLGNPKFIIRYFIITTCCFSDNGEFVPFTGRTILESREEIL